MNRFFNCLVSTCNKMSALTQSAQEVKQGHLFLRLDNGQWKKRFIYLGARIHMLQMNDPNLASTKSSVNLHGCRAARINKYASETIKKTGAAAKGCFAICTLTLRPWYFCA